MFGGSPADVPADDLRDGLQPQPFDRALFDTVEELEPVEDRRRRYHVEVACFMDDGASHKLRKATAFAMHHLRLGLEQIISAGAVPDFSMLDADEQAPTVIAFRSRWIEQPCPITTVQDLIMIALHDVGARVPGGVRFSQPSVVVERP